MTEYTTPKLEELIALAKEFKLSHPRGRAIVALSDRWNGRFGAWYMSGATMNHLSLEVMRKVTSARAKRWARSNICATLACRSSSVSGRNFRLVEGGKR